MNTLKVAQDNLVAMYDLLDRFADPESSSLKIALANSIASYEQITKVTAMVSLAESAERQAIAAERQADALEKITAHLSAIAYQGGER